MSTEFQSGYASATPAKWHLARQMRKNPTLAENKLWNVLRAHRMIGLKFRRQHVIQGFIVDFYCHDLKLVIEVDGDIHQHQSEYDRERESILEGFGIRMIRFSNDTVLNNIAVVIAKIETISSQLHEERKLTDEVRLSGRAVSKQ